MKKFIDMFNKKIKNLDESISKIMRGGIDFSLVICILALFTLFIHKNYYISYDLYEASIMLFQAGLLFAMQFLVCGVTIDTVKKFDS